MSKSVTTVQANFRNAKALVIEDNDDQWAIINRVWQQSLSEVTLVRVGSLQTAISLLDKWQHQEWEIPKLILLDLYLPSQVEGLQFLTWIKAMPSILSCTSSNESGQRG